MSTQINRNRMLESLVKKGQNLDDELIMSWESNVPFMEKYIFEHNKKTFGLSEQQAALMASARLCWLIDETKPELDGMFTEDEFRQLMNCVQHDLLEPGQLRYLASLVADDMGYEDDDSSELMDKLVSLSAAQKACLADILERAWRASVPWDEIEEHIGIKFQ